MTINMQPSLFDHCKKQRRVLALAFLEVLGALYMIVDDKDYGMNGCLEMTSGRMSIS